MKKTYLSCFFVLSLVLSGCDIGGTSASINTTQANNVNSSEKVVTPINESQNSDEPQVKKSSSGICHEIGSTYYDRTQNFVPFDSIDECLNSGGRLPKR